MRGARVRSIGPSRQRGPKSAASRPSRLVVLGRQPGCVTRRPVTVRRGSRLEVLREAFEVRSSRYPHGIRLKGDDLEVLESGEVVVIEANVNVLPFFVRNALVRVVRNVRCELSQ